MRRLRRFVLLGLILVISLGIAVVGDRQLGLRAAEAPGQLLKPAPTQPLGAYDYFGRLLSRQKAADLVAKKGLNPADPVSYQRIGAVEITSDLIHRGQEIFFNRRIGDTFGLQDVFGFGAGIAQILPEITTAMQQLQGQPTSNLEITLQKEITLGQYRFPAGAPIKTGLDVEPGGQSPIGLQITPTASGYTANISCAVCHVVVSPTGKRLDGIPNEDLANPLLVALATNSAAGFARLGLNPLDPQYQGNGKVILNSQNQPVKLPDPQIFETVFDSAVLAAPVGHFESSPDGIFNTTEIPTVFTFKSGPYTAGGEFAVGPFAGLSALNNGVHSSEINLLAAAQLSAQTLGIDPEVYLGTVLQNANNPAIRLPDGPPVKPSEWLRQVAPNPNTAELEDQVPAPGAGTYPNLKPSLFTYNGLVFSPAAGTAGGPFLFAANAMAAWQNSLVPPANQTPENQAALNNGSVQRGAKVFREADCATCHTPPFFTDNQIHPIDEIRTNPARARSRLGLKNLLVAPKLYALNTPIPIPEDAEVLNVPTRGIADSPTTLPGGLLPKGGYKTTPLRGLFLTAPYLHDGGVAVRKGALQPGSAIVAEPTWLGLPGTLSQGIPADPASSLRALLDRNLRKQVIAVNKQYVPAALNLDGIGHKFFVDTQAGFTQAEQTDLINFLLALDDDPGRF